MRTGVVLDVGQNGAVLSTSARLLRLLSLLRARRDWAGAELAEKLEVTPRTVRRDAERLRSLGYPVHSKPGAAGGYRLGAGAALPPLLLDNDEAVAVAVGLSTAAGGTVAGIEEASLRALTKLQQVLPSKLRNRVAALQTSVVPLTDSAAAVDPADLSIVASACRDNERLRFDYHSPANGSGTRTVEPYRLVHTGRRWYLMAWDLGKQDWRTYRVDRLHSPLPVGIRFTPRTAPDAAAYVAAAVSTAPYRHRVKVILRSPIEPVARRVQPTVATLEAIDDATCLLTTGSDSLDAIAIHLALIGVDFEVVEPPELIIHVKTLADRLARGATALHR